VKGAVKRDIDISREYKRGYSPVANRKWERTVIPAARKE
jgi:hypothetical protein